MPLTVDMHAHHVSPDLIDAIARDGGRCGVRVVFGEDGLPRLGFDGQPLHPRPIFDALSDLALRLPALDAAGVGLQLISTWTDITGDDLPVPQAVHWAKLQNDTLAAAAHRCPARFEAMGTLPLQDPPSAIAELDRLVRELGMRSVQIGTHINGMELDHESLRPFWKRVCEHGVFVMLHPPLRPVGADRTGDYFLNNVVCYPADTTLAAARLLFGGVMSAYPELKICLVHGGGFLPYQIGRLDRGFAAHPACSRTLHTRPSDLLRAFYFDTITHDAAALAFLIDRVGADRIVYGTDSPFEMLDPAGLTRIGVNEGLTDDQRSAILSGNIRRALGDESLIEVGAADHAS